MVGAANRFLISYDVCSLFTTILLTENIHNAADILFERNSVLNLADLI